MSKLRKKLTQSDRAVLKSIQEAIDWYKYKGQILRFLTLTGIENNQGRKKNLRLFSEWMRLRMKIFEYCYTRTGEGVNGVIHMLYIGSSVKYKELKKFWLDLTGYWTVSISSLHDERKIIREMIQQFKKQRYGRSRGWFKGEQQSRLCATS